MLFAELREIRVCVQEIVGLLKTPKRERTDQDVEDMAIYYLYQSSGKIADVVRQLESQGIHVRRQSLIEAKKFSRFQSALEAMKGGGPRRGFKTTDGDLEAED